MTQREYNENECSRCEELMAPDQVASKHGEIPFCIDCEGYCRGCGGQEDEELLEHGLCHSCCLDLDEAAEEEENE